MARAVILMYHAIDGSAAEQESRYACPPQRFAAHLSALRSEGYRIIRLADLAGALYSEGAERAVALTLDDGFADNSKNALPLLVQHRIPATVFAVSGRIGGSNDWMHQRGFCRRQMLDRSGLCALRDAGVEIGAHTVTHPRLPGLDEESARREISESKAALEDLIARPVTAFAYPYGAFGAREVRLAREAGFALACSTRSGFNRPGDDPFQLRRIEVHGTDSPSMLLRKIRFGTNDAGARFLARYYSSRLAAKLFRPEPSQ